MAGLGKWLQQKLTGNKNKQAARASSTTAAREAPPYLPLERPHKLTPSPSREDLVSTSFDNFGFFQRLPYEIRRQVLVEAFGNRTLHVDLVYEHPLIRVSAAGSQDGESQEATTTSTAITRHYGLGNELILDHKQPRHWQWFGCVCHRRTKWTEAEEKADYWRRLRRIEACDDGCLKGFYCTCDGWKGHRRAECFIGVMGWLLACRQAYAEGVDVLYSTNTFHMSRHDLMQDLPRLLLPQRLRSVQAVELLWDMNMNPGQPLPVWQTPDAQDTPLHALCHMVPEAFPNLHRLYVSIQCWIASPGPRSHPDGISATEKFVLGPVEDMLRVLGPGREYRVAVQLGGWQELLRKYADVYGPKLRVEQEEICTGRFWKWLDLDERIGYWVCSGWDDIGFIGLNYHSYHIWGP